MFAFDVVAQLIALSILLGPMKRYIPSRQVTRFVLGGACGGLGIAFLSLHTVTEELAHGRLILLQAPQLPILRHWFLVSPTKRHQTAAGAEIARNIVALNGSYLPALPPDAG